MDSLYVTLTTFAIICGGAMLGFIIKGYLREHHLAPQTHDSVKLATGVVATLTALVLGLLIGSAKQSFDARAGEARTFAINLTLLDRSMRLYEPPLIEEEKSLVKFSKAMRDQLWGFGAATTVTNVEVLSQLDQARNEFRRLDPQTLQNKALKDRYMKLSDTLILAANELLQLDQAPIPAHMIGIVDGWLALIFIGFALFAPFNGVSIVAIGSGAGAVAMALFIIVEMSAPFQGFITVPSRTMDNAIAQISTGGTQFLARMSASEEIK